MAKYKLVRDVYSRYGGGGVRTSTFTAKSDEAALCKVLDNCMYGAPEDVEDREFGEEGYIFPSKESLIDRIYNQNGDGCDYILSLENIETGEMLVEDENFSEEEEDWDDEDGVAEDDVEEDDDDDNIAYSEEEEWDDE